MISNAGSPRKFPRFFSSFLRGAATLLAVAVSTFFIFDSSWDEAVAQTSAQKPPPQKTLAPKSSVRKSSAKNPKVRSKTPAPKKSGRFAVVTSPATQIYEKPDLDAKVIATVEQGVKIPVSKGTRGDFAKFHRTRVAGRLGWVLILDVKPEAEARKVLAKAKELEAMPGPFAEVSESEDSRERDSTQGRGLREEREPFAFSRSVSFVLGQTQYKESVAGQDYIASLVHYGFKITGPDILLTGPLMDVNVTLHYGAPPYNDALSSIKPTGFVLWTDANLLLPIFFREDTLVALGAGPLFVISNTQTAVGDQTSSRWKTDLGVSLQLSAGHRFDDISVRLEGKYLFEDKTYHQLQLAVGTVF